MLLLVALLQDTNINERLEGQNEIHVRYSSGILDIVRVY